MADDLTNPFSFLQNQDPVPTNPFYSAMTAADNRRTAQPFIDQLKEAGDLTMQKKRMETGEFLGQEAQGVRSQDRRAKGAEAQYSIDTLPGKSKRDIEQYAQDIRALPSMTDEKIAAANRATEMHKGGANKDLLTELGQAYDLMHGKDQATQKQVYEQAIGRWQQTHPMSPLPQQYQQFDPAHVADLAAIRHSQIYTPEQMGKERLSSMETTRELGKTNVQGRTARDVAYIQQYGHIEGAKINAAAGETTDRQISRLRTQIRNSPDDEESRSQLKSILEGKFHEGFQKDMRGAMLATQASQPGQVGQQAAQQYQVYKNSEKFRLFTSEGLYGDIDEKSYMWAQRAIAANPESTIDFIMKKGAEMGKITKNPAKKPATSVGVGSDMPPKGSSGDPRIRVPMNPGKPKEQ